MSSWEEIAQAEFAKNEEPIEAKAAQLTKFGAPTAAVISTIIAGAAGTAAGAPPWEEPIPIAIVASVAVAGLFYVFAADFRSRSRVVVARIEGLSRLAGAEARASEAALATAEATVEEAEAKAAAEAQVDAVESAQETADRAKTAAEEAEAAAIAAGTRLQSAEADLAKLKEELAELRV